jgi:tRNA(His) 5'-end guanylyltransferase
MPKNDPYGDRMKQYELSTRTVLPPRTFTIVRVDGNAFHTYLKGAEKPFDETVMDAMQDAAREMCERMAGARFAYTQSDEISILLTDLDPKAQAWFGGQVQKIASVSASIATMAFNRHHPGFQGPERSALFDARVYTIPDRTEVMNYFQWRQADAIRNAVSMAGHAHFSHKSLHAMTVEQVQERLFQEKGINFKKDYPDGARRGWLVSKQAYTVPVTDLTPRESGSGGANTLRTQWISEAAPDLKIWDGSDLSDLVPYNGSGPEQRALVYRLGYPVGKALLDTALKPAGPLWAAEGIRDAFGDDDLFRAWMIGMNPHLDDGNPLTELLAGNVGKVQAAHRAYMRGDFA